MKYFSLIAVLLILCFVSCDGKHRALETHNKKLNRSNLSESFFEQNVFVPERYTESVTDTILKSGIKVRVKYYAVMENTIAIKNNNNSSIKTYYREFESQIHVFKNNKLHFADILNKSDFAEHQNSEFWENAILQYVWLDDLESTENRIQINCSFLVPTTNAFRSYKVYFNNLGNREIELIKAS